MEYLDSNTISVAHEHIINTVIKNSRIDFVNESVGEDILQKLRAIWERKISETNVVPLSPPVVHTSLSVEDNDPKKKSTRSKKYARSQRKPTSNPVRKLCKNTQITSDDIVCNRSMPLLTSEEDEGTVLNNVVEIIPELKQQNIFIEPTLPSRLNVQKYKETKFKHCVVKICRFEEDSTIIMKQASKETNNNNIVQKRRRRKKCALLNKTRKQGRPRLLKVKNFEQTKQSTSTKKLVYDKKYQHCTIVQTDGVSDNPKFNLKPKLTGIPVKIKRRRLKEETEVNSDDDITDSEDLSQIFECENVIHCQYDIVNRIKKKWKINLKHGIMHLNKKDYAFNRASCEVEW